MSHSTVWQQRLIPGLKLLHFVILVVLPLIVVLSVWRDPLVADIFAPWEFRWLHHTFIIIGLCNFFIILLYKDKWPNSMGGMLRLLLEPFIPLLAQIGVNHFLFTISSVIYFFASYGMTHIVSLMLWFIRVVVVQTVLDWRQGARLQTIGIFLAACVYLIPQIGTLFIFIHYQWVVTYNPAAFWSIVLFGLWVLSACIASIEFFRQTRPKANSSLH